MLINDSFIAELMGKQQIFSNIVIDVFDLLQKYEIKSKKDLEIILDTEELINEFRTSINIQMSELVRLKLIEMNKIQEEDTRNHAKLKLEEIRRKNAEILQKRDNDIEFEL